MRILVAIFLLAATVLFVYASFVDDTSTQVILLVGGAALQAGAFSAAYARPRHR